MDTLPYAEDLNYFKTSKKQPGTWLDKAEGIIEDLGGAVSLRAKGKDQDGREAYLFEFSFGEDTFRIVWPILPSRTDSKTVARRQAATMIYRDVKTRVIRHKIHGPRIAFFEFWQLPDGRTAGQLEAQELTEHTPQALLPES